MRPSQIMRSGGDSPIGKYGKYLGGWGNLGSQTQRGIIHYGLSANAQRPLAGTLNAAIFNTWRRFSHQVLYFAPPLILGYVAMNWAIERNEYLNSKEGRLEFGEEE
ncbi:ubiquinol-cytochrome c reductase complex ubiquinone-binding protein [Hyaloscypha bicolor E]|uniref:Cytochrome b-c1 complex subunit 8 n=1 Tax=Hyaloscypha bicolor E TaxID=1095630 RepID=A0A2J6TRZ5_9HELO|nr:ubiquinol-cytochrome c reductase complex ubiquinone-binding protein [Hyaloscypha bicolor E]KAH8754880.1 ubiquinol-cytochrome c reductase complex ubiquinone-binding protein [Hyaloscypha finlandica]KAH8818442.1 ubiquinol-cytochrome c reductase complex ubiquinone-binding protein [Hyaloscypha sp. PMI_1271]PMD65790.1 ubiquinol-cytochrome c reductase complex ubiquinone-binding protein [Hyaloscypha bicolor E]